MPNTARTKAAILQILADNLSEQISPQDLRDLVESIANPVAGGGFDQPLPAALRYADNGNFVIHTDELSPIKYADAGPGTDPEGWFTDEASYTSGFLQNPVPQGGLLRLPPGWYDAFIFQQWSGNALDQGADFNLALVHADNPATLDPLFAYGDTFTGGLGLFTKPVFNAGFKSAAAYSTIRVPSFNIAGVPVTSWPVCAATFLNHQLAHVTGWYGSILIRKVGRA